MGGGHHDYTATDSMVRSARASGRSVMGHSADIAAGRVARKVHTKLDPKRKNRLGEVVRESLDSTDHPASTPIAVIFDTTGSMGGIPEQLVNKLGNLMKLLNEKNYVTDPQVLFGAINDADCGSDIPLEVGQFESSNEMDNVVTNIFSAQSGGGGNHHESYELAMYFLARKTRLDCITKRNKKGYCFIIGDELPYDEVSHQHVQQFIGDDLGEDVKTSTILAELREKFNVFWIFPTNAANSSNRAVTSGLNTLFGEQILRMSNADEICELIAATIAVNEGRNPREVQADLKGTSDGAIARRALESAAAAIPGRNITLGDL